jgi:D-alanyl-lipoteichoic acid acyltransferase DltB (MBOAT superfamily)
VQDFWRRWHMSLSSWLRDYLYIPLGGSRHGEFATYRNILITMTLGGLWHGAALNYIIWGVLHGVALMTERLLGVTGEHAQTQRSVLKTALGWFLTLQFVCIAWIFFRAGGAWLPYFTTMLSGSSWTTTMTPFVAVIVVLGALSHIIPPRWFATLEARYDTAPLAVKVLVPFVVIYLIAVAAPSGIAPFIYFQF